MHVDEPREKCEANGPIVICTEPSSHKDSRQPAQSRVGGWWLSASAARMARNQLSTVGRQDARWAAAGGAAYLCPVAALFGLEPRIVSSSVVARDSDPGTGTTTLGSDSRSKNGMLRRGGGGASRRFQGRAQETDHSQATTGHRKHSGALSRVSLWRHA